MIRASRIVNGTMAALFLFGAVVQLNDPDPVAWIAVYLVAAATCVVAFRDPTHFWLPALLAAVCVVWAAFLLPDVVGRVPFLEMFSAWEMKNIGIERSREMYGLLIIATWMCVLVIRAIRSRRAAAATH